MTEDGDPLRRPSELLRDRLGQSGDPRSVALGLVALFEPADDRSEHARRLFPGGARTPLQPAFEPALAEVGDHPPGHEDGREPTGGEDSVALDRVGGGLPAIVRDEADERRPADPAGRVPEEEPPPLHPGEPGDPGGRIPQHGDEATEEHGLAAVSLHQRFGARQEALRVAAEPSPALEERAAAPPADDPVPEVVADDRCGGGDRDHFGDVVVPLRGEHAEQDQRCLTGERDPERLDHHDHEEERQAVARDEVRHRISLELPPMRVGVARETAPGERRVALVPETAGKLAAAGFDVVVDAGAGEAASFLDADYTAAGVALGDAWASDVLVRVRKPDEQETGRLHDGQLLVGFLDPLGDPAGVERIAGRGVTAFAMESIPRITRAQSMDALSSQATVGGYRAALLAAEHLPRFFPMLMTAAGTVPPAKVLVIGAGVAGLQALATARLLGAVTTGFDVRPVVREQIESLGANWLDLGVTGAEAEGGYARELTPEEMAAQQQALEGRIADFDAVITTAAVPGRPAPKIIPASAVEAMRPGSVIVDLAAETGGNCELTEPGAIVERARVTLVGLTNLPSTMPYHASMLYSRNVQALLVHLAPGGELNLDWSDETTAGACVAGKQEGAAP